MKQRLFVGWFLLQLKNYYLSEAMKLSTFIVVALKARFFVYNYILLDIQKCMSIYFCFYL